MRNRLRWVSLLGVGLLVSLALGAEAREPECTTTSGKTACGYNCVASDGLVRCSQTPAGVCSATSGVVTCWDPPPVLLRLFGALLPRASCVSSLGGQTACGYNCEIHDDRVMCAQTPFGVCEAREGKIACWDPPVPVLLTRRLKTPAPECITGGGNIACGYHCIAHGSTLRCAQTPEGTCTVEQGNLLCWDPPLDSYPVTFDPASERACLEGFDGRACGYGCLSTLRHSACGAARDETCRADPDGITCKKTAP
jgi:hypothetical protein